MLPLQVDKYLKEILDDLMINLTNSQWRVRESRYVSFVLFDLNQVCNTTNGSRVVVQPHLHLHTYTPVPGPFH